MYVLKICIMSIVFNVAHVMLDHFESLFCLTYLLLDLLFVAKIDEPTVNNIIMATILFFMSENKRYINCLNLNECISSSVIFLRRWASKLKNSNIKMWIILKVDHILHNRTTEQPDKTEQTNSILGYMYM